MVKINAEDVRYVIWSQYDDSVIPVASSLYVLIAMAWPQIARAVSYKKKNGNRNNEARLTQSKELYVTYW